MSSSSYWSFRSAAEQPDDDRCAHGAYSNEECGWCKDLARIAELEAQVKADDSRARQSLSWPVSFDLSNKTPPQESIAQLAHSYDKWISDYQVLSQKHHALEAEAKAMRAENERLRSFERGWREIEAMYGRTEEERKREDLTHYLRRQKDTLTMKRVEVDNLLYEKKRLRASLDASSTDERIYTRHVFEMDRELENERHRLRVLIADRDVLRNEYNRLKRAVSPESDPSSPTDFVAIAEISREQAASQETTAFENSQLTAKAHESIRLLAENERLRRASDLVSTALHSASEREGSIHCNVLASWASILERALAGKEEADAV